MSRKPPKLAPVEGKETLGSGNGKSLQTTPQLKQGGNISGSNAVASNPRRSSYTRHFLNCNGSSSGTRRRFPPKLSSVASITASPTTPNSTSPTDSDNVANGCVAEKLRSPTPAVVNSTSKVNGTISNGITSTKANEPNKLVKRSKSLGLTADNKVSTDVQRGSVGVNGKKTESVHSRGGVSNSIDSQNNPANVAKRTSRFSQSSAIVSKTSKGSQNVPLVSSSLIEDTTMPALVACESSEISKEDLPERVEDGETPTTANESISEEPKIIRKGDTVIKSYVDEKTGKIAVFERGMKLEVCDFGSGRWYPAKVMNIDWKKQEILVHYSNWSSRYDEWISMLSSRIRPGIDTNVVRLQFTLQERVEALWPMDSHRYAGTVTQILPQDCYEITFDDGIKIKRSAHQLFKISPDAELQKNVPPSPIVCSTESNRKNSPPVQTDTPSIMKKKNVKSPPSSRISTNNSSTLSVSITEPQSAASPLSTEDPSCPKPNRLHHFSVFDPPQGELGKRKRTVHDYSALVKGRQGQRTVQIKGPRRPKSEGMEGSSSPCIFTTLGSEEANSSGTTTCDVTPKPIVNESPELGAEPKRRQKSGSTTQVPSAHQPQDDTLKELPQVAPVPVEPLSVTEQIETPSKKRKQTSNTQSVIAPTEAKIPPKPDVTSSTDLPTTSTTTTTTARRTKSMTTMQFNLLPPFIDTDVPKDTKVDSGFVDEMGNVIIIEQNIDDGFWKCPLNNCGKNFRKDSLLKMHFKHYHPELKVANARGIANVVQMAQARTAFDNDPTDYHTWPKQLCTESISTTETSSVVPESPSLPTLEGPDTQTVQKKTPKLATQPKHSSPGKTSAIANQIAEDTTSTTTSININEQPIPDPSKALSRSPRLRLSRKRNFVLTKFGKIRASNQVVSVPSTPVSNDVKNDETVSDAIATDGCKKTKFAETVPAVASPVMSKEPSLVDSPNSSLLSTSNTPSPSVSDQYSVESYSGSSTGDVVFAQSNAELEPHHVGSTRTVKGRWSKTHLRRGLISSNIRRVGSGKQNSTTLFLKKRMQLRKFMGKRGSRQKRVSILSRISSGRMRVVLEALNHRSLKNKRFRAVRRYRDVKVDVINCVCSSKTEFGLMIQCELCLCWQHGSCFNVQSNSQLPDFYACQSCSEPEKVRLSRKFEWAESEFYRLGKVPSFSVGPSFSKEHSRIMKMCTNLSSNLLETYSMIKGLKIKERICFGLEHPQLYEWNSERAPPHEEIQRDRFNKYFKPVLRRLLLENKSDPTYQTKLRKLIETRMKLRKYSDAVDSAKATLKKKLGCRAAAFVGHICDKVLNDMIRSKRKPVLDDAASIRKDNLDIRKRLNAEQAYQRLRKIQDEATNKQNGDSLDMTIHDDTFPVLDDSAATSSQSLTGIRRDASLNVKDYCLLKKYLKERRSVDININLTITRMSEEFPNDWRNLMKISRMFITESRKDVYQDAKLKWITNVIVTYNTLRILLRQIYSENNSQKQKNFCLDFERTTSKLLDLFGIGLAEERIEIKKQRSTVHQRKRICGLETLDMVSQPAAASESSDFDDVQKENLNRSGTSKPKSRNDVVDLPIIGSDAKKTEEVTIFHCNNSTANFPHTNADSKDNLSLDKNSHEKTTLLSPSPDVFLKARKCDGHIAFEFNEYVTLLDAVKYAGGIPEDECTEDNICLEFPENKSQPLQSAKTGIIPVPADSHITPDVCRKNLVRDILLQQHQIDAYLDKIESQIIKLSSQSRIGDVVVSMKPTELSAQRTWMLQSMELVSRLSKTLIGDNDVVEPTQSEDMDASETTISDYSDMDLSSDSDGFDNASNYSGTDTETADEGDITGDDDLLDV